MKKSLISKVKFERNIQSLFEKSAKHECHHKNRSYISKIKKDARGSAMTCDWRDPRFCLQNSIVLSLFIWTRL